MANENHEEEGESAPLPKNITVTNENLVTKHPLVHRGLGLTDNFGVELAIVVGSAIFFRRLWILHGIHFIVLRRTLRLAIAWIDYFFEAGIYEEIKRTAVYIFRFYLNHTEKALSGDSMRLFFAASWLQTYNAWGYHIWFAILRRQYKHVNKLELNEQEDKLQTTEMLVEKRRQQQGQQKP
ncbi:unnamed protein product [Cylindrotheca closterium]|uniref:Uncharacterized protein n=1 Tax=Cylindrotheca closterium TaxID=2856 RepID=A0AAD2CUY5_9STRA|nr:unnamed protein product [Cylindrotheca closterium]